MKISFRQSGGFAGVIRGVELDSQDLPPEEAAALRSFVERSAPLGLIEETDPRMRDPFTYEIAVETDEGSRLFTFDDGTVPEGMAPLLRTLKSRSGPRPPA